MAFTREQAIEERERRRKLKAPTFTKEQAIEEKRRRSLSSEGRIGERTFQIGEQGQASEITATPESKRPLFQGITENITPRGSLIDPKAVLGGIETGLTVASAGIAEVTSGIAGMFGLGKAALEGNVGNAEGLVENVQKALTFQPRTEAGKQHLENIGRLLSPIAQVSKNIEQKIGETVTEKTGSPALGGIASAGPALLAELIGLRWLQKVKAGTTLIDKAGNPTKQLRIGLDKQGLSFHELSDNAKSMIPEKIDAGFLSTPKTKSKIDDALIEQIKSGGKEDALAGLEVKGDKVQPDVAANKAIKQGFRPGLIQSIKTSNPATKTKMLKMSKMMQRIQKQEGLGLKFRPSDVIGDSVTERIGFIRDKADQARINLNVIAEKKLRGQPIETGRVINTLEDSLSDLDVTLREPKSGGKPIPDFKNSLISKDRSSQRAIKDVIDLMSEGGGPDALRFHKLKRQLDIMIDFKKKSALGLSDAGKKVLKKVRFSINESLRDINVDYADVNDILSESLTTLDNLDEAVGTIDIFGKGSNKAIGQKMRALLSNQQGRIKLENAIDGVEDTVAALGGKFGDNVQELVLFSDALNNRFGTTAKTSFAGQITQATEEAARRIQTPISKASLVGEGIKVAGKGVEKLRGINDFNAFESLNSLLLKGNE